MSLSLYEINSMIASFQYEFDEETGELLNADELDELELAKEEKIENLCLYIKSLRAEAKAIKEEEGNLAERRKAKENKADKLEEYVGATLSGNKFETPRVKVQWRKTESVEIPDDALVPDELCENTIIRKPNKKIVKARLKKYEDEGVEVPWARIVRKNSMSIK